MADYLGGDAILPPELPKKQPTYDYIPTTLLTTYRIHARTSHPRSLRGVSGDILKAERGVASCGRRLVTVRLGRPGTPPARHYDLAARSSLHGSEGNCPPL
jgi:hypothetical protein